MSKLGAAIKNDIQTVELRIGIFEHKIISAHAGTVIALLTGIETAAKNPIVEGFLTTVLPPGVMSHYPQFEAFLGKAINTITLGTQIEAAVAAATTTEAKLIVFVTDLNKTNAIIGNSILRSLGEQLLALLDNTAMTSEIYAYYLQAEKLLNAA
jgi:hypothetical protein